MHPDRINDRSKKDIVLSGEIALKPVIIIMIAFVGAIAFYFYDYSGKLYQANTISVDESGGTRWKKQCLYAFHNDDPRFTPSRTSFEEANNDVCPARY